MIIKFSLDVGNVSYSICIHKVNAADACAFKQSQTNNDWADLYFQWPSRADWLKINKEIRRFLVSLQACAL